MPVTGSSVTASHLEDALQSMLGNPISLDQKLVSASKKILLQKIEFEPARKTSKFVLKTLRSKYTSLNASSCAEESSIKSVNGLFFCMFLS